MVGAVALYGGVRLTNFATDARFTRMGYLFSLHDINWQYLQPSTATRHDDQLGEMKFWDIVVEGSAVLKDAAWVYVKPPQPEAGDSVIWREVVGFRVFKHGDPANPHFDLTKTGQKDGIVVEECWFG